MQWFIEEDVVAMNSVQAGQSMVQRNAVEVIQMNARLVHILMEDFLKATTEENVFHTVIEPAAVGALSRSVTVSGLSRPLVGKSRQPGNSDTRLKASTAITNCINHGLHHRTVDD